MAKLTYALSTSLPLERVLAALTDFSERRPDLWPGIDRNVYRVHERGDTWAVATEGSAVMGGIWARECYDWSEPGLVRVTVEESNVFHAGSTWQCRVTSAYGGGSEIEVSVHRRTKWIKGRLIGAITQVMGRRVLPQSFRKTLAILERETAAPV